MASNTDPKVIVLNGDPRITDEKAGGAVTPGHLVARSAGTYIAHGTAAANAAKLFALETPYQSNLPAGTKAIDKAYASGDSMRVAHCRSGDVIYALLAANAAAVTDGAYLESAGDGTIRIATADAATDTAQRVAMVAQALEAIDNSAGGAVARTRGAVPQS